MNTFFSLKTFRWVGFLFIAVYSIACEDELNDAGLEVNPSGRVLIYHDSLSQINSYTTQPEDLILINRSNLQLGYLVDPRMGVFQNNFMAEVSTLGKTPAFGDNTVADSVVLFLKYTSVYGDTITPQSFAIYELNKSKELEYIDSTENTDANISQYYDADKYLGTYTFIPNDTTTILKFKLPDELAQRLIDPDNIKYYDTVPYFNAFVFRGLYLVAKPLASGGGTCSFSYTDSTFVKLYFHNSEDTTNYTYIINSSTTKCNIFNRGFNSDINLTHFKTEPDPTTEQELCYIKGNYGSDTRIDISGLSTWSDSGYYAINLAYLKVPANYTDTIEEKAFPPFNLGIYQLGSDYTKYNVEDYLDATTGVSSTVSYDLATKSYYIRLTKQLYTTMQSGKDTLSIVLTSPNNATQANRMILYGALNTDKPIKLITTYTKFN